MSTPSRRRGLLLAAVALFACTTLGAQALPAQAALPSMSTATKTVVRNPATPPLVTGIRVGRHATFDRVVVDLSGAAPGYRVGYVSRLVADGSGLPVRLRGNAKLQIVLNPAYAHTESGAPTLRTPERKRWFYPQVKEYALVGDFEAYVTVGVGLARKAPFRVFTLSNPTRIVVDVAH